MMFPFTEASIEMFNILNTNIVSLSGNMLDETENSTLFWTELQIINT